MPGRTMRIARPAPFLDDGVTLIQEGDRCWAEEARFSARPWASLWIERSGATPPAGWFFLNDAPANRKTIADCVKEGLLELANDDRGKIARVI